MFRKEVMYIVMILKPLWKVDIQKRSKSGWSQEYVNWEILEASYCLVSMKNLQFNNINLGAKFQSRIK